jgi:hypothetical protein
MPRCLKKIAIQLATKVRYHTVTRMATALQPFGRAPSQLVADRATIQPVSATRKPVVVRKLSRDWCAGYAAANPAGEGPGHSQDLEILDNQGKLLRMAWDQVKWVCYVRELGVGDGSATDTVNPERLLRRRFSSRPRMAGLWLRLTLADGEELEGVAANDRSLVDEVGLMMTPPDTRSNTQRVFVPRNSIRELTVLGVIGLANTARRPDGLQPELFDKGTE